MDKNKFNINERSVAASELSKALEHEIRMDLERYFDEQGLRNLKNLTKNVVPIDDILNFDKFKKLGVTRNDLLNAISESEVLEINGSGSAIQQSPNDTTNEENFEPKTHKKVKTENGSIDVPKKNGNAEPKIFKMTLSDTNKKLTGRNIQRALEKQLGLKLIYSRVHGFEGYFAVDASKLDEEEKKKLAHTSIEADGSQIKIQECANEDLDKFFMKHGKHLDYYLGRLGHRSGLRDTQTEVELLFYNPKYPDPAPLRYIFEGILSKNKKDEVINIADASLLSELLTFSNDYDNLSSGVDHYTTGFHPDQEATRCFFAVDKQGNKKPFTFDDCLENLMEKFSSFKEEQA